MCCRCSYLKDISTSFRSYSLCVVVVHPLFGSLHSSGHVLCVLKWSTPYLELYIFQVSCFVCSSGPSVIWIFTSFSSRALCVAVVHPLFGSLHPSGHILCVVVVHPLFGSLHPSGHVLCMLKWSTLIWNFTSSFRSRSLCVAVVHPLFGSLYPSGHVLCMLQWSTPYLDLYILQVKCFVCCSGPHFSQIYILHVICF